MDEGEVGAGQFVVAGGEAAVLLEPADQALDDVALAVGAPIHQTRPGFSAELGNDRGDAAAAEVVAHRPAGVAAIGQERSWFAAWPTRAATLDRAGCQQRRERRLLVALAGGQDEGDGASAALAAQVQLGAEPAARAAERLAFLPPLAPAA